MNVRLGIVTGEYLHPGQTFINRHIQELFGGNSVVICERRRQPDTQGKQVLCLHDHRPRLLDALPRAIESWAHLRKTASTRPPTGAARRALAEFLHRQGVQALLVEQGQFAPLILFMAQETGLPLFVYFRGYDATGYLGGRAQARRVKAMRGVLAQAAGIFAVSGFLLDQLATHGLTHPRAQIVPSGVDLTRFRPGTKETGLVLSVGRFIDKKAPMTTLRAFAQAAHDLPDARLVMIGDGPHLDACRAELVPLGLSDRVSLPGALSHADVRAHLARADIYTQHSVTAPNGDAEGAPSAIQEAMACGCAIVSTRHAGIPGLVCEGRNGMLVAEHDLHGHASHLRTLLTDPTLARDFGADAARTAQAEFDVRALYDKVEATIRAVVQA
jgi:colanic acid/amylovoran biosynthesis glycosyltransferase